MSWLPMYNSWVVMAFMLSVFMWNLFGLLLFIFVCFVSIVFLVKEFMVVGKHFASGFWLFIMTEVLAFGTLFVLCLWTEEEDVASLSEFSELPLLGCFLLTGSSITVTTYHHYLGSSYSWIFLVLTILLGCCFMGIQLFEFYDSGCDLTFCMYQAVCFCTVGLHFSHVLAGVVALSVLLFVGDGVVSKFKMDFVVWYWHFVDYVWLFVYLIIYIS